MTPWFVLKETVFYLQGSNLRRTESTLAQSPPLQREPALSLLPKKLQAKIMPRSPPYSYLSLSWPGKQISIFSGMCTWGFQSHHCLTAVLSFRIWDVLFSAPMEWTRNCAPCYARPCCPRGWNQGKHVSLYGTFPPEVGFHPLWGLSPLVGLTSPGTTGAPVCVGSRARGPECSHPKSAEGESLHQALKSYIRSPHTKRTTSPYQACERKREHELFCH